MRRFLAGTGKVLITVGLLILLFVAYQLWGTGLYTARAQHRLKSEFQQTLRPSATTTTTGPPTATPSTAPTVSAPTFEAGDPVGEIVIPKIGIDFVVVQGVEQDDLRQGPGHYPATPLPGQAGNAAIAGHRTTYQHPFGDLDQLDPGDMITVTTVQGVFNYRVYSTIAVSPDEYQVLDRDPTRLATLTLTTCTPKYSAAQRLIVQADLVVPAGSAPLPSSVDPNDPAVKKARLAGDGLSGNSGPILPTILMGIFTALVGACWWLLFHRHPRMTTWLVGAVPFAVTLFFFYVLLERALPANY